MKVDGAPKLFRPGTYKGQIEITISPLTVFGGTALAPRLLPPTD